MPRKNILKIYTDTSCSVDYNMVICAYVLVYKNMLFSTRTGVFFGTSSGDGGEEIAIDFALKNTFSLLAALGITNVKIYCDNHNVVDGYTGGFKCRGYKPLGIANESIALIKELGIKLSINLIDGNSGKDNFNRMVDRMCRTQLRKVVNAINLSRQKF